VAATLPGLRVHASGLSVSRLQHPVPSGSCAASRHIAKSGEPPGERTRADDERGQGAPPTQLAEVPHRLVAGSTTRRSSWPIFPQHDDEEIDGAVARILVIVTFELPLLVSSDYDYEGGRQASEPGGLPARTGNGDIRRIVANDFDGPNGLAFSPDETQLYVTEIGNQRAPSPRQCKPPARFRSASWSR
jgi:hypothetical protein